MHVGIHSFVLRRLQSWKGRWPEIAHGTGISLRTIEKIARQEIEDPGVSHVERLANFFMRAEKPKRKALARA